MTAAHGLRANSQSTLSAAPVTEGGENNVQGV